MTITFEQYLAEARAISFADPDKDPKITAALAKNDAELKAKAKANQPLVEELAKALKAPLKITKGDLFGDKNYLIDGKPFSWSAYSRSQVGAQLTGTLRSMPPGNVIDEVQALAKKIYHANSWKHTVFAHPNVKHIINVSVDTQYPEHLTKAHLSDIKKILKLLKPYV